MNDSTDVSDDWDFYYCRVDDKPASIYLDLAAIAYAPLAQLPHMAFIRLRMREPRADGLSSQAEFGALCALEDHLVATILGEGVQYVGRCTTNGCRDFVFYIADAPAWPDQVAACMAAFPDYSVDVGVREDPQWSTYSGYLYPGERDMQIIQNRRVCQALEEQGDTLQAPREIDHWLSFANAEAASAFAQAAAAQGFAVRQRASQADDQAEAAGPCTLQLWRHDTPGYSAINEVTLPLFEQAKAGQGVYEGWECPVVRDDAGPTSQP